MGINVCRRLGIRLSLNMIDVYQLLLRLANLQHMCDDLRVPLPLPIISRQAYTYIAYRTCQRDMIKQRCSTGVTSSYLEWLRQHKQSAMYCSLR